MVVLFISVIFVCVITLTVTVTGVVERDKDMPGNISGSPGPSSPRYLVMYHIVS